MSFKIVSVNLNDQIKYKEIEIEETKYEKPEVIKKKILELEEEIIKTLKEIEVK